MAHSPICQALNLSDGQPCKAIATTWENVFCKFHGKQCHGLYIGYKRRNAKLDSLLHDAPPYLQEANVPLANETFHNVTDEKTLQEIHDYIYHEYVLLGKVIDARKLHHKHFYPLRMDYGHQAYLDHLSNRRHIVFRALEKLETRIAQILYEKEKWYEWVREVQEEEEATREKESKRVKLEAAMFKRYWNEMQNRLRTLREKEEKQRQNAYLDAAYQERTSSSADIDDDAEMWDPIEDILDDQRNKYIDLIKHFLWMGVLADVKNEDTNPIVTDPSAVVTKKGKKSKSKSKSKSKAAKAANASQEKPTDQSRILEMLVNDEQVEQEKPLDGEPDKSNIETETEMRIRLKEGVKKDYTGVKGLVLVGSLNVPQGSELKTAPLTDKEIDSLAKDIKEIKLLLFCRLLLSHASLLPAAVRSSTVKEFLDDPDISESDLRDLCLRVEQPSLQVIRDACADLIRGDESEGEDGEDVFEEESIDDIILQQMRYGHLQSPKWMMDQLLNLQKKRDASDEEGQKLLRKSRRQNRKMKIQVCGKSIWNYSSESSMSRDGWLQFSVMAKDCDLRDVVKLCRNWDEFSYLNFLTTWQYFPASKWVSWGGDKMTESLHENGFFPFFQDFNAQSRTHSLQVGNRSRVQRQHDIVQARNIIAGHMKRNDAVTCRFLQYLTMRGNDVCVLVRDGKTGKILTAPTKEDLWTMRRKQGLGRASKKEWNVQLEVGHKYFKIVDESRTWHLGFEDYYDVWIWDYNPGRNHMSLFNTISLELYRALRITKPIERHDHKEPFLRALTRDQDTLRVRSIQSGEQALSLWDEVTDPANIFLFTDTLNQKTFETHGEQHPEASLYTFYNKADVMESKLLFYNEETNYDGDVPFKEVTNLITDWETSRTVRNFKLPKEIRENESLRQEVNLSTIIYEADNDENERKPSSENSCKVWKDAVATASRQPISDERKQLLRRVGLLDRSSGEICDGIDHIYNVNYEKETGARVVEERNRGHAFFQSFFGVLETDLIAHHQVIETSKIFGDIFEPQRTCESTDWVWFLASILDWLELRADYDAYTYEPLEIWPHPFIMQDMVKAFILMSPFFPSLEVCQPATGFFKSEEGEKYKDTAILNPSKRAQTLPDCRSRTSFDLRPKEFWERWEMAKRLTIANKRYWGDAIGMGSNAVTQSIIAWLYQIGIIMPSKFPNNPLLIPGFALAKIEPDRPSKIDLFIDYSGRDRYVDVPGSSPTENPDQWPNLLPHAKAFALSNMGAKFAVLRVFSPPHFYPQMLSEEEQFMTSFLDSRGRSWMWRFLPKDAPRSGSDSYRFLKQQLEVRKDHLKLGDRVVHRNEVILVMGTDELELLRYVTAVTFLVQTRPWYRCIDLWKSFVNVDIEFLEGLDPYWLD